MGSPLDSSQFVRLLDKRLREVAEAKYKDLASMIPRLYRVLPSDSAWEEFYDIGALPDIPEFTGRLTYLGITPGYHKRIEPKEWALGMMHERKLLDDKKYAVLDRRAASLMESAHRTREKQAVRAFNLAFSAGYDFMTSEENVSLCSDSHTTKSGTSTTYGFDNAGTAKFSKTSAAATRLLMKKFRNDISERIEISDRLGLVVPSEQYDKAFELTKTPKGMDSGEGNVNPAYGRYELIEYPRLDDNSTVDWFMVDVPRMKDSLIWIDRIAPEVKSTPDFETYMLKTAVYARFGYGWIDWRWIFGNNAT